MNSAIARSLVVAGSLAAFLVAAKAHGRQVRLERELAGHWKVVFGGSNPPFVEAMWQRERVVYWSIAALLALVAIAWRVAGPRLSWPMPLGEAARAWWATLLQAAVWPMVIGFVVAGLASLVRLLVAARSGAAPAAAWWSGALWGSAAWWSLTLALAAAVVLAAALARRPG